MADMTPYLVSLPGLKRFGDQDNQDAVQYLSGNGVQCIALGDGLSMAGKYAGLGAKIACSVAVHTLCAGFESFWTDKDPATLKYLLCREFQQTVISAITRLSQSLEPAQFATTLLAVAVKDERMIIFGCGNGAIVTCHKGHCQTLRPSQTLRGKTVHLAETDLALLQLHIQVETYWVPSDLTALILLSDGCEDQGGFYDTPNQKPSQALTLLLQEIEHLRKIDPVSALIRERAGQVARQSLSQDDLSMAILHRVNHSASPQRYMPNPDSFPARYARFAQQEHPEHSEQERIARVSINQIADARALRSSEVRRIAIYVCLLLLFFCQLAILIASISLFFWLGG